MKSSAVIPRKHENGKTDNSFSSAVLRGLSSAQKNIPCSFLYDEQGSRLFGEITDLAEYYPTRCELEIIESYGSCISEHITDEHFNLIELGSGDGKKTKTLLDTLTESGFTFRYVPIDISQSSVDELTENLSQTHGHIAVRGIISDYFSGLHWLSSQNYHQNVVLFLGSSIGNFAPDERVHFLQNLYKSINSGDLVLIGFDLIKNVDTIVCAYNDSKGITESFNKNILCRINRELGGNFDPDTFRYYSTWDAVSQAVHSFLVSSHDQRVPIKELKQCFSFHAGEPVHTESSYKFSIDSLERLAYKCGFETVGVFTDDLGYFADCLWRVTKK